MSVDVSRLDKAVSILYTVPIPSSDGATVEGEMRHTLREDEKGFWSWSYRRGWFFACGTCKSRYAAIRNLLEARTEGAMFERELILWLGKAA